MSFSKIKEIHRCSICGEEIEYDYNPYSKSLYEKIAEHNSKHFMPKEPFVVNSGNDFTEDK